jgi:hypothetical protein
MPRRLVVLLALALSAVASAALAQSPVVHFTASSYTIPEHGNYYAYVHIVRDGDLSATTYFDMTSTNVLTHQVEPSFGFTIGGVRLEPVLLTSVFAILRVPATLAPQQSTLAMVNAAGTAIASQPIEVTASGIAVESVTPQCLSTDGGTLVTIAGRGFQPGAVVTFGIADATEVTVRDAQTITARVPASSGVSAAAIVVTNPTGETGRLDGFHYRWPDSQCGARHRAVGR